MHSQEVVRAAHYWDLRISSPEFLFFPSFTFFFSAYYLNVFYFIVVQVKYQNSNG